MPVAGKKRSPESIAKFKATVAAKKRAAKKQARKAEPAAPLGPSPSLVAEDRFISVLDAIVRNIVREEIRRMLS